MVDNSRLESDIKMNDESAVIKEMRKENMNLKE